MSTVGLCFRPDNLAYAVHLCTRTVSGKKYLIERQHLSSGLNGVAYFRSLGFDRIFVHHIRTLHPHSEARSESIYLIFNYLTADLAGAGGTLVFLYDIYD